MATVDARLAAVIATPADLELRRAYAESNGCDPARARIIAVEDQLASGSLTPADTLARTDERETLLARNGVGWAPDIAALAHTRVHGTSKLNGLTWERGFVSHVDGHADRLTELDLLAASSCYSLRWTTVEAAHLDRLELSALLPRLRRLHLEFLHGFPVERIAALLRSAKLGPLVHLGLVGITITTEIAEAIAAIPTLESLYLASRPISGSLAGDAATPLTKLDNLRRLTLSGQDIPAKQFAALLDAPFVATLERLGIHQHKLGAKGCKTIGAARFEALTELDLSDSNVAQYGVEFAGSPKLAGLRRLGLDASKLGAKHLPAFLAALDLPALRVLTLAGLRLKEAGAEAIANSDAFTRNGVTGLSLAGNALGDDGAELLAGAEGLAGIRKLRLNHNGIRAEGVAALADSPLLRGLEALDIQSNKLQTKGAIALSKSVAAATLREIDIDHNWIGSKGATALFGSQGLVALEALRLGFDNNFEDAAVDALAGSDIRLRTLIANSQGTPEAIVRYLESPAIERLTRLQSFASQPDLVVDRLASGALAPSLHTVYVGTNGVAPDRVAALDRRCAFSAQRGNEALAALE